MKKVITKMVGRDFAESSAVVLEQTAETLLLFKPEIHPGGVRGSLVRYKKDRAGDWLLLTDKDFQKAPLLSPKTKLELELSTEVLHKLTDAVRVQFEIVRQGIQRGETEYVVAERDKVVVVDDNTKREIFNGLLAKGYSDEFWKLLHDSQPELATSLSVGHLYSEKIKVIDQLRTRLASQFSETTGPDSWQRWIYANNWLFGINYVWSIEKAKVNVSGSMPDYLFLTADYFVDVLEIKLPSEDVIVEDKSHPGAYKWCPKTNEAIGQVVYYLGEVGRLQLELEREIERVYKIKVSLVRPRGFVLIGESDKWDAFKRDAFRNLNFSLHGVEVLTYSDLLKRGSAIAQMYKSEIEITK